MYEKKWKDLNPKEKLRYILIAQFFLIIPMASWSFIFPLFMVALPVCLLFMVFACYNPLQAIKSFGTLNLLVNIIYVVFLGAFMASFVNKPLWFLFLPSILSLPLVVVQVYIPENK